LNLPTRITWTNNKYITYQYNALGQKVSKSVNHSDTIKTVNYLDGFQYAGNVLQFFPTAEGYVKATPTDRINSDYHFNYIYNYTDHLGNVRLSYTLDPQAGTLKIVDEHHYYPFGLRHEVHYPSSRNRDFRVAEGLGGGQVGEPVTLVNVTKTAYQYKFGAKELQDELGLDWYDYGARNYDPALGRWMNVDPLAEKFVGISSYNYAANNPVIYIDPDGKDIYRFDKKTGELILMEKNDDEHDTIAKYKKKRGEFVLKKDRNGNNKTHLDNIAKGILHDGINFREENNTIAVNGINDDGTLQATTEQVEDFIKRGSAIIGKEVSGYYLGDKENDDIKNILIWKYKNNSFGSAEDLALNKNQIATPSITNVNISGIKNAREWYFSQSFYAKSHFHTHPNVKVDRMGGINTPSGPDKIHAATAKLPHYILNVNGKFEYDEKGSK